MKKLFSLLPAAALAICSLSVWLALRQSSVAQATPAAAKEVLIDIKKVEPGMQKTPSIQAQYVKDKRWLPKDWIEVEVELEAALSKSAKDRSLKAYQEVTLKYYIGLEGPIKDKNRTLTGEVVHANVPIGEKAHSVMYITPSTIFSVTEAKTGANLAMVRAWGVEAYINGELVGRKTSVPKDGPWWEAKTAPPQAADLKNKLETPFSPLFGDYYLDIRAK